MGAIRLRNAYSLPVIVNARPACMVTASRNARSSNNFWELIDSLIKSKSNFSLHFVYVAGMHAIEASPPTTTTMNKYNIHCVPLMHIVIRKLCVLKNSGKIAKKWKQHSFLPFSLSCSQPAENVPMPCRLCWRWVHPLCAGPLGLCGPWTSAVF